MGAEVESKNSWGQDAQIVVIASLTAGATDLLASLLRGSTAVQRWEIAGAALAATAVWTFASATAAWPPVALFARWTGLPRFALFAAASGFFAAYSVLAGPFRAFRIPLPIRAPEATWSAIAVAAVIGAGVGFAVWSISQATSTRARGRLALAPAAIPAAAFTALWQVRYGDASSLAVCCLILAGCVYLVSGAGDAHARGRRTALLVAVTVLAGATSYLTLRSGERPVAAAPAEVKIPAILLLSIDTLRADTVSAISPATGRTPNLDRLAADSFVFHRAFSPAPWTLPALTSIMTGHSVLVHQADSYTSRVPDELPVLAERLRDAGYHTAAIGFNGFFKEAHGLGRGFAENRLIPRLSGGDSFGGRLLNRYFDRFQQRTLSEGITRQALDFLDRQGTAPFFLWLHYFDPHAEYAPPKELAPKGPPPPGFGWEFSQADAHRQHRGGGGLIKAEGRRWIEALYRAEAEYVDSEAGRVLNRLRELDLYDSTLIVFLSDHGEQFWEHDGFEHGRNLYNEEIRAPLMIKTPGGSSQTDIRRPVTTQSVYSTILDLARIDPPDDSARAASLVPALRGEEVGYEPLLSSGAHRYSETVAIIGNGHKLITSIVSGRTELYDLDADPAERVNLAALEKETVVLAQGQLAAAMEQAAKTRKRFGMGSSKDQPLDPDHRELLRSLGYVQ